MILSLEDVKLLKELAKKHFVANIKRLESDML